MESRPIRPVSLILNGLLGVGLTLFFYWIFRYHAAWVWPWGATVFVLVIAVLATWAIIDRQRRHQRQP